LADLTLLSKITNRVRILSLRDCGQGELVLDVAKELGMQLWLGLWVGLEESVFEEEKTLLEDLIARDMIDPEVVLGISVGSEAIYRKDATVSEMVENLNESTL
jgi:exo-beta-1,3-glucanase (GH17 family)